MLIDTYNNIKWWIKYYIVWRPGNSNQKTVMESATLRCSAHFTELQIQLYEKINVIYLIRRYVSSRK